MPLGALYGKNRANCMSLPGVFSFGRRFQKKTFPCKNLFSSALGWNLKKLQKKSCKKLAQAEKGCTFAPAITAKFFTKWGWFREKRELKIFSSKSLLEKKKSITFAPRKSGSSLRDWVSGLKEKGNEKFLKKNFDKSLRDLKRISTFAPASWDTEVGNKNRMTRS